MIDYFSGQLNLQSPLLSGGWGSWNPQPLILPGLSGDHSSPEATNHQCCQPSVNSPVCTGTFTHAHTHTHITGNIGLSVCGWGQPGLPRECQDSQDCCYSEKPCLEKENKQTNVHTFHKASNIAGLQSVLSSIVWGSVWSQYQEKRTNSSIQP